MSAASPSRSVDVPARIRADVDPVGDADGVVDAVPVQAVERVETLWAEPAPEGDEALVGGDKRILDILDDLPPTDPARLGLRVTLEFIGPDRVARIVPGDWSDDLPTQQRVADLVAMNAAPPGNYRVLLRRGRQTMPHIRFPVAPPIVVHGASPALPAGGGSGDAITQLRGMAGVLREMSGGNVQPTPEATADLAREVEQIAGDLDALDQRVSVVEATVEGLGQVADSLLASAGEGDGGIDLAGLMQMAQSMGLFQGTEAPASGGDE